MENRTQRQPESRWWKRWEAAYQASGGWLGPATLAIQRENAIRYFQAGASANAAGLFCAEQYQLHSRLTSALERAA